ncbi:hypothetical protein BC833DRAFT_650780 [Globomyces pollinis-pini]|nr:hypothetical protein BC833DRAFT_650780 [Globomyces pollinis-pini]
MSIFLYNALVELPVGIVLLLGALIPVFPSFLLPLTKVNLRANILLELASYEMIFPLGISSLVVHLNGPTLENGSAVAIGCLGYHIAVGTSSLYKAAFSSTNFGPDPEYVRKLMSPGAANVICGINAAIIHYGLAYGFANWLNWI